MGQHVQKILPELTANQIHRSETKTRNQSMFDPRNWSTLLGAHDAGMKSPLSFRHPIRASCTLGVLLIGLASCAPIAPGPATDSFAVVTDLPAWAPGRPQVVRQVVWRSDGSVQDAQFNGQRVERLQVQRGVPAPEGLFPVEHFMALPARYQAPPQPGLVVEGRGHTWQFVFHTGGRSHFITADDDRLPPPLQALRAQLPAPAGPASGLYVQVRLLDKPAQDLLRPDSALELGAATLHAHAPLQQALAAPFQLVPASAELADALQSLWGQRPPPYTCQTPSGEIARWRAFR